jgi:hypothetical protein
MRLWMAGNVVSLALWFFLPVRKQSAMPILFPSLFKTTKQGSRSIWLPFPKDYSGYVNQSK